jgi:hypothetical protein
MVYQVYYGDYINSEIVLIDLTQDPVRGRWANLKEAKRQIIHHLKKEMNKDVFSLEEKNIIKKRIVQINKITKKQLELCKKFI